MHAPLACCNIRRESMRRLAMTLAPRMELEYRMQGRVSAWHFRYTYLGSKPRIWLTCRVKVTSWSPYSSKYLVSC